MKYIEVITDLETMDIGIIPTYSVH